METQTLAEATELVRRHFPKAPAGELYAALALCRANDGLYTIPGKFLFAFFRYDPRDGMLEVVENFDVKELSRHDLRNGAVAHIVAFVYEKNGYRVFRRLIKALNPYAISFHRLMGERRRFNALRNVRWGK